MITPIEIRQHSFRKSLRGFDTEEVMAFMNSLSLEWEKVLGEQRNTRNELEKTRSNLENLRKVENVLHKTLLQAEQTSKSTIENAKKNAELKVAEAESKSKEIIEGAMKNKIKIQGQIDELLIQRLEILNQMNLFIKSQQERLKNFEQVEMKTLRSPEPEVREPIREEPVRKNVHSFFEKRDESNMDQDLVDELADQL